MRALFFYLIQLIKIFTFYKFAPSALLNDAQNSVELLNKENASIKSLAEQTAKKLLGKTPVIYSLGSCEGVSVRFRQQINENSKMLCWHHVFPEMNHNELVGWTTKNETFAVVTFKTSFDYERTVKRYEVCKPVFEKYCSVAETLRRGGTEITWQVHVINSESLVAR